ncbi:MAG: UDP-N-acetylglucosamine 1-carboxyvinyltransferase [Bacteroidetes bacterium]|nr:UDP-N-acetylglucosamine 1-carboxyvinyltransferase [Bacteroidota bacterium]
MSSYTIRGGKPLSGEIVTSGNKNSALPCIAAALLTDEEIILHNIPDIEDVRVMLSIMESIGAKVVRDVEKTGTFHIRAADIKGNIPEDLAQKIRASILFAGPMLARTGKIVLAPPGGDVIGLRRLDTHFLAFSALGAYSSIDENGMLQIEVSKERFHGNEIFLDEMSVTATENAVMAAVFAPGKTVIRNAASEPHIQDLCNLLISMGADILGTGSNLLTIVSVKSLHGSEFTIGPDYIEIGSFVGLAAATHGDVVIHGVETSQLPIIRTGFRKIGINWEESGKAIRIPPNKNWLIQPDISGMIPKIDDAPWPGFPPDLLSIVTVVATQSQGTVLVHEKMFESRMFFIDMLIRMGARIILCDPHRAVISGPALLHGALVTSPDIRAGMALVIASLCAQGESVIQNVYQIERGYENLCEKLQLLGADITRNETI